MGIGRRAKGNSFTHDSVGFEIVYERNEITIPGYKNDHVDARCDGHGINGHADIPVGFFLAAGKFLDVFDFELDTVGGKGFKKSRFFTGFGFGDVGDGANKFAIANGGLDEFGKIHS